VDSLVYEDRPQLDSRSVGRNIVKVVAQIIAMLPVVLVFFVILFLVHTQIRQETVLNDLILALGFITMLFYFGTWSTKYQIFGDRIRIAILLIFHFDIPFSNIENVREATLKALFGFHLNFVHPFSGHDVLQINMKRGPKVNIISGNRPMFLENLNKAIYDWKRGAARVGS
jgi:hypothetical protein